MEAARDVTHARSFFTGRTRSRIRKEERRTAKGRTREGESNGRKDKDRDEREPRKIKKASELLYEKALGLLE